MLQRDKTVNLHLHLLQAVLVPVLQYECQVWGMHSPRVAAAAAKYVHLHPQFRHLHPQVRHFYALRIRTLPFQTGCGAAGMAENLNVAAIDSA